MSELKPCPFCGAKGVIIDLSHPRNPDVETYHVDCLADCDMGMGQYKTREAAIAAWNTRATDTRIAELEAEVERLRGLLKQQPGALVIAYEDGDHQRLARETFAAIARAEVAEEEVARLSALVQP